MSDIVYGGTPDFAVPSLTALAAKHEVVQVVTRPDAIRGRGDCRAFCRKDCSDMTWGSVIETARMTSGSIEKTAVCALIFWW